MQASRSRAWSTPRVAQTGKDLSYLFPQGGIRRMKKLKFTVRIAVPRQTAWKVMLEDRTYRAWTAEFSPGSYYTGDWSQGSRMRFLAPGKSGLLAGMISRVLENRPYESISIEHVGVVHKNIEDTTSDAAKAWAGAKENYTFTDLEGETELMVELDLHESYLEMFGELWPKALCRLKEIAENTAIPAIAES
jgi:hypothetical protein